MRLLEISAKNYRTLADTSLKFSRDYCTLSGQNNAGKSCVIRLMAHLLEPDRLPWRTSDRSIDYGEDKTQWVKGSENIHISWALRLYADDDPALISFVETFADQKIEANEVDLRISSEVDQAGTNKISVRVQDIDMGERASREIVAKLRGASCLFLHNSPSQQDRYIYGPGRRPRAYYEVYLSEEEQKMLSDAAIAVQRKTRKLAKGHRDALSGMLGKLSDKYDVEFSTYEGYSSREMPLAINLRSRRRPPVFSSTGL